jgi:integrase
MRRLWKERSCVYIVTVDDDFVPTSAWTWPGTAGPCVIHAENLTLKKARSIVRAFNEASLRNRSAGVAKWDRQWAIAACCTYKKGHDHKEKTPERKSSPADHADASAASARKIEYKRGEITRLLSVCDSARLPIIDGIRPGLWWRDFINVICLTGLRVDVLLRLRRDDCYREGTPCLHANERTAVLTAQARAAIDMLWHADPLVFPWPHSRRKLDATFNALAKKAGINNRGFRGLRLTYFSETIAFNTKQIERAIRVAHELSKKGGHEVSWRTVLHKQLMTQTENDAEGNPKGATQ